jgi:hypothetical protein
MLGLQRMGGLSAKIALERGRKPPNKPAKRQTELS